jgi:hypothetical protein
MSGRISPDCNTRCATAIPDELYTNFGPFFHYNFSKLANFAPCKHGAVVGCVTDSLRKSASFYAKIQTGAARSHSRKLKKDRRQIFHIAAILLRLTPER